MSDVFSVYREKKHLLVMSGHGEGIYYRIFYGLVKWSGEPQLMKPAVVVFMQYGETEDWNAAIASKELRHRMPAHILMEDVPAVVAAIAKISEEAK